MISERHDDVCENFRGPRFKSLFGSESKGRGTREEVDAATLEAFIFSGVS